MTYVVNDKVFLIASAGGHKYELLNITKNFVFKDKIFLTFKSYDSNNQSELYLVHPKRQLHRIIFNFFQSFYYLLKLRPKIIISTGADVALFTLILGKFFFRTNNIFIESFCTNSYSITGKISYYFSDLFIVHHREQLKFYPNAIITNGGIL